jgi:hypothetical protein
VSESTQPRHIPHAELELLAEKVTQDGGELRQLTGEDYGTEFDAVAGDKDR